MKKTRRIFIILTAVICLAALTAVSFVTDIWHRTPEKSQLKVGFVYTEDESTPYTGNFIQAQHQLENSGADVRVYTLSNVNSKTAEDPIRELVRKGCTLVFVNDEGPAPARLAKEFPGVQFCQMSSASVTAEGETENYHTFNGEVYQARYVSGVAAGMKLRQLIDSGVITAEQAVLGYVAPDNGAESVSGWTAFLLGAHSAAPEATLQVRTTGSWSSYSLEKQKTQELIDAGCLIISQHTNTSAPATVCERAAQSGKRVFYIGYNQSMLDLAPTCTLMSIRINWAPYITGAVQAVSQRRTIERTVRGKAFGRDMCGGFEEGWLEVTDLNTRLAAPGTQEQIAQVIELLRSGKKQVFKGNYTGVNPTDSADTIDLRQGYTENAKSSCASFRYILDKYVTLQ